jgi:hypothetical protein
MSNCRHFQELIEDLLADDISTHDQKDLDEHCVTCSDCSGLLELHQDLQAMGAQIPLPERHDLQDMREAVLKATAEKQTTIARTGFLHDLGNIWKSHPLPSGLPTAALLACIMVLAQWNAPEEPQGDQWLQPMIQPSMGQQASLDSYWDSQFTFSNVSVRPQGQGQLALSFDACRHLDLQVAQDSPLAKEVLLHAIMEPASMGSRLQAMEVTPAISDGRLKEALIYTMINDQDVAVRLNALAVLARYPYDQKSQDALLQTLGQDPDVQMRILAMDELARREVGDETIRQAMGDNNLQGNRAILKPAVLKY